MTPNNGANIERDREKETTTMGDQQSISAYQILAISEGTIGQGTHNPGKHTHAHTHSTQIPIMVYSLRAHSVKVPP